MRTAGASGSIAPGTMAKARHRAGSCMGCSHECFDVPLRRACRARPTFRFCAGPRTRRRSCCRRRSSALPPSASPTATRWPASCARMWRRKRLAFACWSAARLVTTCGFEVVALSERPAAYGRLTRPADGRQPARERKANATSRSRRSLPPKRGRSSSLMPPSKSGSSFPRPGRDSAQIARGAHISAPTITIAATKAQHLAALARLRAPDIGAPLVATQRRALSPCRAPPPRRRARLHPREMHHRRGRLRASKPMPSAISKKRMRWPRLFARHQEAVDRTVGYCESNHRSRSSELKYEYPDEPVPPGKTAQQHLDRSHLARSTREAEIPRRHFRTRSPRPSAEELTLIEKLDYARYFLTVHDVVALCQGSKGILCQGRGSAANSAVCYMPRHHRHRSRRNSTLLFAALPLARAQRAARYRRRFRARAARRR